MISDEHESARLSLPPATHQQNRRHPTSHKGHHSGAGRNPDRGNQTRLAPSTGGGLHAVHLVPRARLAPNPLPRSNSGSHPKAMEGPRQEHRARGTPRLLRQAVQACVAPVLCYGAEAWWPGLSRTRNDKAISTRVDSLDHITTVTGLGDNETEKRNHVYIKPQNSSFGIIGESVMTNSASDNDGEQGWTLNRELSVGEYREPQPRASYTGSRSCKTTP